MHKAAVMEEKKKEQAAVQRTVSNRKRDRPVASR